VASSSSKIIGSFSIIALAIATCLLLSPTKLHTLLPYGCVESIRQGSYELVSFCDFSSGFNFSVWNENFIVSSICKCFLWW
jgi:hypothetical protein